MVSLLPAGFICPESAKLLCINLDGTIGSIVLINLLVMIRV